MQEQSVLEVQARPSMRRALLRQVAAAGLAATMVLVFRERFASLDIGALFAAVTAVGPLAWVSALALTALSYWAIGRYDGLVHGVLGTGISERAARHSGVAALAIGQAAGFGVITGALVRFRMLPRLGPVGAARVAAAVAAAFFGGWAVVTASAVLLLGLPVPGASLAGAAGLAAFGVVTLLSLHGRLPLPPLRVLGGFVAYAAVDTVAATAALFVLLPPDAGIAFGALLPAFLVATGAGLMFATPGGIGPFEVALLTLIPAAPQEPLLAAVLAFRLVYHALPALLALPLLARPRSRAGGAAPARLEPMPDGPALERLLADAPVAEAGLARQGHCALLRANGAPLAVAARTGQALVALAPLLYAPTALREALASAAHLEGRTACLYKIDGRAAAEARRAGWAVRRVGREAVLDPRRTDLSGSGFRQLRRKLRKAEGTGLVVRRAEGLPLAEMARVNAAWVLAQGGARGFSMGRFGPDYVAHQVVLTASLGERLVAFATFHASGREWTLDLMRQTEEAPDGTMHALVAAAIAEAAAAGCPRLSLAAVPEPGDGLPPRLAERLARLQGTAGLQQFKAAFAPAFLPRYAAAPSMLGLLVALGDIAHRVVRPLPLARPAGFASGALSWHGAD